jgi:hypothetical protein
MFSAQPVSLGTLVAAILLLISCSAPPPPATSAIAPPPILPKPIASVLDLMSGVVAPTADGIWGAVGTSDGPKGPVDKQPSTDKEWASLRQQVLLLAEAANLLSIENRHVASPGQQLTNPSGPGDLSPDKSEARIKAEWPTWLGFAQSLQNATLATVKAVDAQNIDAYTEAGGAIDEACEQCHKRFWYPDAPTPSP